MYLHQSFATLSCISSLAVAPMLPIWRLTPSEYYEQEHARHTITLAEDEAADGVMNLISSSVYANVHKRQVKAAQQRARVVLSFAILLQVNLKLLIISCYGSLYLQVVMQWSWAIFLFVSPFYSQPECSGDTVIVMFLASFTTRTVNSFDGNGMRFLIWPMWLLFCLGVTLTLTILLALSSPYRSTQLFSRPSALSGETGTSLGTPALVSWAHMAWEAFPPWHDRKRQFIFWSNFLSAMLWAIFVIGEHVPMLHDQIRRLTGRNGSQHQSCRRFETVFLPARTTLVDSDRFVVSSLPPSNVAQTHIIRAR